MALLHAVLLKVLKTTLTIRVLGFTWFAANRVASYWELWRKARETDLAIAGQFRQLFGEFKEIWRRWKVLRVEAVKVKLTTERTLTPAEIRDLGLFRQVYQTLRKGIRDGSPMDFGYRHAEYQLFNRLGCRVAHIVAVSTSHDRPSPDEACGAFEAVLATRSKDWVRAVETLRQERELKPWPATGESAGTDGTCCHPDPGAVDAVVRADVE